MPACALVCAGWWHASGGAAKSDAKVLPAPTGTNPVPSIVIATELQARAGVEFEILPSVANVKHAPMFSANNLPTWAHLDPATGRIAGTPATSDIGLHEAITLVLEDGTRRVASSTFDITVAGPGSGVATLEWRVPLSKLDGTRLDDLAGYRISYGRDAQALDHNIFIDDPAQTSYEFSTLDGGVWYFAIVAVNSSGLEGTPSVPVRKTI